MSLSIKVLEGKTLTLVENFSDTIVFTTNDDKKYKMYHEQESGEDVHIEDISGDLNDLIGIPILVAEEVESDRGTLDEEENSFTWTFYKIDTAKGGVTIRWYGTSNGYYSESVDIVEIQATPTESSSVDIERWLAEKLSDAYSRKVDSAFINGTGVGTPSGILNFTHPANRGEVDDA